MKRLVIIGLDGVPHRLLDDLSKKDVMPNTGALIEKGVFKKMQSSIPEVSSIAWSSIITGSNPGQHSIFGFTDFPWGTYRLSFPNFRDLKVEPFWRREDSGRSVVINVPSTYPAKSLNGVHIAGFVALYLEKAVYPDSLVPRLNKLDYRIDVDSSKAHKSLDLFLKDLDKTLKGRMSAYRYLWDRENWNTFMLVFTGTDRLSHFLWDAYEDESHKYHSAFLDHFRQIDEEIGEITERLDENDSMILLSDHGFELLEKEVNINFFLKKEGFLKLRRGSQETFSDIDYGTRAFALDPARIYVNTENRYPRGSVKLAQREEVIKELESAFNSLEVNAQKVIKHIYKKEDLFEGPFYEEAPDLVLVGNTGFNLKANIQAKRLLEKGISTGKHTQQDAFILVKSDTCQEIVLENATVFDVVGIINRLKN